MNDITSRRSDYGKLIEVFTSALYHRLIRTGDKVVDAGANAGMHLFPMSKLVGAQGKVHAFEPNPKLIQNITKRLLREKIQNVELHQKALHKEEGHGEFLIYPDNPGLSHLAHDGPMHSHTEGLQSESINVDFYRLDQVITEEISFIKSDLEGADFLGLLGAKEIISKFRPIIIFENGRISSAKQHNYSKDDYFSLFSEVDYMILDVHGLPLRPRDWENSVFSYECLALPCEDFRLLEIMSFIQKFWSTAVKMPEVKSWGECTNIGRTMAFSPI